MTPPELLQECGSRVTVHTVKQSTDKTICRPQAAHEVPPLCIIFNTLPPLPFLISQAHILR